MQAGRKVRRSVGRGRFIFTGRARSVSCALCHPCILALASGVACTLTFDKNENMNQHTATASDFDKAAQKKATAFWFFAIVAGICAYFFGWGAIIPLLIAVFSIIQSFHAEDLAKKLRVGDYPVPNINNGAPDGDVANYGNDIGVATDDIEAAQCYHKAAEQGDADAQFKLGVCYANGTGVVKGAVEAVKWYRKAAEQGDAKAQSLLGVCYANGTGVTKDDIEAAQWLRKAAEQGNANAQFLLGLCYAKGIVVVKDPIEAAKLYHESAEQGNADAQFKLGVCYANGTGVATDDIESVKWYRKAAEQGNANAQFMLGICYTCGAGVVKDAVEACKWYSIGVASRMEMRQRNVSSSRKL